MNKAALLLGILWLCAAPIHADTSEEKVETLSIGAMLCLSGNCSDWGTAAFKGVELATEELNAQRGILGKKITLKVEDTQESISGAKSVGAFRKLVDVEGLKFVIGPSWSPGALSVAPLAARRKDILLITPSASAEEFSRAGSNIFNMRPTERQATESLAHLAMSRGWKRLAILGSSQPAESTQGNIFKKAVLKEGGTITRHIETNPELPDVRTEALQIVASKPDAIFLIAYNQMLNAITNLKSQGFTGPILTISIDDARVAMAPELFEGIYVAKALPPSARFVEKFRSRYGEAPGLSAENGYDAIVALSRAIKSVKSFDPPVVSQALTRIRFDGAAGPVSFSAERAITQSPAIFRILRGQLEAIRSEAAN